MRNPFILLSLCAVAARAQSVPCPSDPVVTGADGIQVHVNRCGGPSCSQCEDPSLYSSVSYPGRTPSSEVFCGQTTIWAPDPSGPDAPFIYHDNGWEVDSLGNCYGSRGGSKDPLASRNPALKAEIRGWIAEPPNASSAPGYTSDTPTSDGDQEKVFYVSLDVGWTPAPQVSGAGVQPINTLDLVNRYVPAFNTIQFGGRDINPNTQEAWGGLGTAIVHIEIDAWSPARGGDVFPNYDSVTDHMTILGRPLFQNWVPSTYVNNVGTYPIWWPFPQEALTGSDVTNSRSTFPPLAGEVTQDLQPFRTGDYVRVVGTLWEDGIHSLNDSDWSNPSILARSAKYCWWDNAYQHTRGWAEMHSVDYIARIQPPANQHMVAQYAICADGSNTPSQGTVLEDVHPAKPYDSARSKPYEFSALSAVNLAYDSTPRTNLTPPNPFGAISLVGPSSFRVYQTASVSADGPGTSRFAIEAVMSCAPSCSDRCGDDGCGGTCSDGCSAIAGHACPPAGGACTCSAPGWGLCSTTGNDCRQTATCPSCPLGTTGATAMSVIQGSSNSYNVTVTGGGGPQAVNLVISGVPAGETATFSPSQVTVSAGNSAVSTLTISSASTAAVGSYGVVVSGTPAPPPSGSTCSASSYSASLRVRCPGTLIDCGDGRCYRSICP